MTEWKNIKATEYCLKVADGTHDSPKRKDFGKPLITSKHIRGRNIDFESAYLISEEDFNQINQRSKVDQWDILISMIGEYCGFAYVERNEFIDYAVKNVGIFKTGSKLKAEWLYYYLISTNGKNKLTSLRGGTSQPYIPLGALRELEIPIPNTKKEMLQITSILSSLDDKIELNLQMNQTLETMAQAIFKEWFVDFNFPGFDDELVDGLPKGWRIGCINDIANVIDCLHSKKPERSITNTGYVLLQLNNIKDNGLLDLSEIFWIEKEIYNKWISRIEISEGDCVITNVGRVGAVSRIPQNVKAALGRNMTGIRLKKEFPFPAFLITLLVSELMKNEIEQKKDSGTILEALNVKNIPRLSFPLAPQSELITFENIISPIWVKMEENIKQIETLVQLRDSLLPKLMSGKIEIKA